MWSVHPMEHHSTSKWEGILTPATAHVGPEDNMPQGTSRKDRFCVTPLTRCPCSSQIPRRKEQWEQRAVGGCGVAVRWDRVSLPQDNGGDGCAL